MVRKADPTKWLTVKIFQKTNNLIAMRIESPDLDKPKMTGIEHSDQYHGNQMKRTHNKLFFYLKTILERQGRWENKEAKLGKKKDPKKSEFDVGEKYGFIYITTNTVNGMAYIGKHTTFGDDYLGSGKDFKEAVKKFGKDKFVREDVAFAYSAEHLNFLEKSYIDMFKANTDSMFYNSAPGGEGWYEKKAQLIMTSSSEKI
ncbi:hypothetical protein ABE132_17145 [Peribacillus simplex]|uniref:hypothetical protein n=1 Tax=Peribacillus simplex TaxID=1478 RepID=UPI003D29E842